MVAEQDVRSGGNSLAPALSVSGLTPEPVTVRSLTAGGCALLLFVNEDCPTSALAMRTLGPPGPGWESAGLSCPAVFEDPLEVAIRVARRNGWTGRVVSQPAPYQTSRAYGLISVPAAFLIDRTGQVTDSVPGWDQPGIARLIQR